MRTSKNSEDRTINLQFALRLENKVACMHTDNTNIVSLFAERDLIENGNIDGESDRHRAVSCVHSTCKQRTTEAPLCFQKRKSHRVSDVTAASRSSPTS